MWSAIAAVAGLLLSVLTWLAKQNDARKKAKEAKDRERKDAIKTGDISALHNIIDRLRRK